MSDIKKLHKLRDISLDYIPYDQQNEHKILDLFSDLEITLKKHDSSRKDHTWATIKETVEYYGIATHTIHIWRREGKLQSRPAPNGKRMAYEYYLDPHIKEQIDEAKKYDKRWS